VARRRYYLHGARRDVELTRTVYSRTCNHGRARIFAAIRVVGELRKQTTTDQHGHTQTHWVWVVELQIHPGTGRPVVFSGIYGMLRRRDAAGVGMASDCPRAALDVPP